MLLSGAFKYFLNNVNIAYTCSLPQHCMHLLSIRQKKKYKRVKEIMFFAYRAEVSIVVIFGERLAG